MAPPHLDLSQIRYTHADMIISARKSPRLPSSRHSKSYMDEKGPLSSTSSRFSFNNFMASPLPSPSLPALVPRHGKPNSSRPPRKWMKTCIWLSGVLAILYFGLARTKIEGPMIAVGWETDAGNQYEMVGESELPSFPTPVVVTDKRGRSKWTVSIPPNHEFPLTPAQYSDICLQNMELSSHVADLHSHKHKEQSAHYGYYHVDPHFMDVAEAEAHGLLPGIKAKTSVLNAQDGSLVGENTDSLIDSDVCEKTMTFVLETPDAGLGKTLMMLWTAYGLAQKEGRQFFVDDTRWAYGKYTTFFKPPPVPKCRPPPRHEMLPCPHHARHLVVSAATARHTFGGAFSDAFEDARKMEVYRQKPMFEMARVGYESLFNLADEDAKYVKDRVLEFETKTVLDTPGQDSGTIVGIHVRHGDRRPYEFQYRDSYIPLPVYKDKAHTLLEDRYNHTLTSGSHNEIGLAASAMVLASDDPDVYDADEFKDVLRAQEQIRLASKNALEAAGATKGHDPGPKKFVDETIGWEGGFFAGMFWSLGKPGGSPGTGVDTKEGWVPPSTEALRLRELVARAYLMDLAVLGRASDKVVCTVSAMGCRLLMVMMGWEKAVVRGGFVNVDGDFQWRGVEW